MRRLLVAITGVGLLIVIAYFIYDWVETDKNSDVVSIKKDNAKSLDVDVRFGVGNLLIESGGSEWVDGEIDSEKKKWYPNVTYKTKKRSWICRNSTEKEKVFYFWKKTKHLESSID